VLFILRRIFGVVFTLTIGVLFVLSAWSGMFALKDYFKNVGLPEAAAVDLSRLVLLFGVVMLVHGVWVAMKQWWGRE
jgi:hypothetical protein